MLQYFPLEGARNFPSPVLQASQGTVHHRMQANSWIHEPVAITGPNGLL